MSKMTVSGVAPRKNPLASFTLIELLTVIAIIAILAALVLGAGSGVWTRAARSRAAGEIQGMSDALDSYKTDNGIYPNVNVATGFSMANSTLLTNTYTANDGSLSGGLYQQTSQLLYLALSGQTNFTDTPAVGVKVYMNFKRTQVGDSGGGSYVQDPWQYSYGYSTGTAASYPYNGNGFFDLWSTGGLLKAKVATTPTLTNAWVANWR
ncbi:MAG: prepilin-type N-terminal cleavage/methylation domain-containing protein [Methylacidiphilales bacterium]|nr:prepilin-type N-terminal cleavage/methylation domain-containing protein [Candidatus Methylacidiphilales bacterium]